MFSFIGPIGVAIVSSYVTLLVVAESTPRINEDGEEEYSLPGYILHGSANVVKWGIKMAFGQKNEVEVVESVEGKAKFEDDDDDDENELII